MTLTLKSQDHDTVRYHIVVTTQQQQHSEAVQVSSLVVGDILLSPSALAKI